MCWCVSCPSAHPENTACLQLRALRTLAAVCTLVLGQFPGVPSEDEHQLATGLGTDGQPLSQEMQLALRFRMGKKRVLLQAIAAIADQVKVSGRSSRMQFQVWQACCSCCITAHKASDNSGECT